MTDLDRLAELERLYSQIKTPHSFWSEQAARIDLDNFRGHYQYLSQAPSFPYDSIVKFIRSNEYCEKLYGALEEDGAFGCVTAEVDGKIVSRDLLDSVMEINSLKMMLGARLEHLRVLDIGAGYGRFAHRLSAFSEFKTYCTDAVPASTVVCEKYIEFRKLENVEVVPLHELNRIQNVDLAVNIHSWSECTNEAINFWLDLISDLKVPYLFVVPHNMTFDTNGPAGGPSFRLDIEKHGYRLVTESQRWFGGDSGDYFHYLFERQSFTPAKSYPDPMSLGRDLVKATTMGDKTAVTQLTRLRDRSVAYGAGAGTHLPLLTSVVATAPPGDVLECGAGHFSSPVLSMLCHAIGRKLITLEQLGPWFDALDDIVNNHHILAAVPENDWLSVASGMLFMSKAISVAFVDHGLYDKDRLDMVKLLKEKNVPLIVVHDTRNPWLTETDKALDAFKYRFDYTKMSPVTTVVSDTINVSCFDPFKDLK